MGGADHANSKPTGMMLDAGLEKPRVSAWLIACRSIASATASRTQRSCHGADDGVARTLCAPTSSLSTLAAGQGRRQPIKSGGTNKGGVDSKAVFLRPRPGGGALAGRELRV